MNTTNKRKMVAIMLIVAVALFAGRVFGDPSGASISNNTTESGPTVAADSHAAARSTITTMVLDSTQQDEFWKGYVGNVTGSLSLDDANSFTIYDWSLTTITGEVYATRATTPDWSVVACANATQLTAENTFHNMTDSQPDNVNGTFNATAHASFVVAGIAIPQDNCSSQALFVNDARQAASSSADFQEVVLRDNNNDVVFASLINDDAAGFDNGVYDFQMIVPESNIKSTPTTYYFYLELG